MQEKKSVSRSFINAFGLGDFGFQIMVNIELVFFMLFLTDAVKFSPATAGMISSITGFFDILWVFVAGLVVQRCNFRWGKFRSWLLIAPPIIWALFIFQFWGFSGPTTLSSFLICFGFIASHLIWNCSYTSHISMISAYTDDISQRTTLSSRRMLFQALGKILFSVMVTPMIAAFGASSGNTALGYTYTCMLVVLIMVVCYWIVFALSKPYEAAQDKTSKVREVKKEERTSAKDSIVNAAKNSQLIALMLTDFGRCFAFYLVTSMTAYYFNIVIGDRSKMTSYLLFINISAAVFAFVAPYIAKKIGKKNTYFVGMIGYAVCLLLVYAFGGTVNTFYVVMILGSGLLQLSFSMGTAMFADTVVFGEWKTGVNARGFIMGLYSLPIKTGVLVRATFMTAMLAAMNYKADTITPEITSGVRNMMTIYPAIVLVICAIFGYIFYKLTDEKVVGLAKEIADRNRA